MLVVKNLLVNAGTPRDAGLIPGLGRYPGRGHGNLLQYSCLENPMDRRAWWTTVLGVTKSWAQLKWLSMHTCIISHFSVTMVNTWLEEIIKRTWTVVDPQAGPRQLGLSNPVPSPWDILSAHHSHNQSYSKDRAFTILCWDHQG